MRLEERIKIILDLLEKEYGKQECFLHHENEWQLLIATCLSAQCTDERVNQVTKTLFKKYRSIEDFANADLEELEQDIRSTGFYKNKAKNIKACCQKLLTDFDGKVPQTIEELTSLAGVGRKTANVVLGNWYGIPGIVVDTHVKRLSNRLGLTNSQDPVKIEFDVMKKIPEEKWIDFNPQLITHGRTICKARKPTCESCFLLPYCPTGEKNLKL